MKIFFKKENWNCCLNPDVFLVAVLVSLCLDFCVCCICGKVQQWRREVRIGQKLSSAHFNTVSELLLEAVLLNFYLQRGLEGRSMQQPSHLWWLAGWNDCVFNHPRLLPFILHYLMFSLVWQSCFSVAFKSWMKTAEGHYPTYCLFN